MVYCVVPGLVIDGTSFCTHFKITAVALDKQEGQVMGKKS